MPPAHDHLAVWQARRIEYDSGASVLVQVCSCGAMRKFLGNLIACDWTQSRGWTLPRGRVVEHEHMAQRAVRVGQTRYESCRCGAQREVSGYLVNSWRDFWPDPVVSRCVPRLTVVGAEVNAAALTVEERRE